MHPILIHCGPGLRSYGLMLAIAFLVGIWLAKLRAKKEGVDPRRIESLSVWIVIAAIVGARLLHVIAADWPHYREHPLDILAINRGGLAFYGGEMAAVLVSVLYCWKNRLDFWKIADLIAPSIALGLGITRLGCFLAGCCYGLPCDLPWAVTFTNPEGAGRLNIPLHPTQIYESLASLGVFFVLIATRSRKRFEGQMFFLLLLLYGAARFGLEYFRDDVRGAVGPLSTSQFISAIIVPVAVALWVWRWRLSGAPQN